VLDWNNLFGYWEALHQKNMKVVNLNELTIEHVSHNPDVQKRVLLENGEIPHITQFAHSVLNPGQISSMHSHSDMSEVFFIQSGSGEMQVDEQVFQICQGMMVSVRPNEAHEIRNTSDEQLVLLYFGVKE